MRAIFLPQSESILNKETVRALARDFELSGYCSGGDTRGGGITAKERASIHS